MKNSVLNVELRPDSNNMESEVVKEYLTNLDVKFIVHTHKAVYTCEEADKFCKDIPGIHSKNLFLKDNKDQFYLVILPDSKKLEIKLLESLLSQKEVSKEKVQIKLKFASEEDLDKILKVKPGSVSPLALINDTESKVTIIIDEEVWSSDIVSFHPGINTETLELTKEGFHNFVFSLSNKFLLI